MTKAVVFDMDGVIVKTEHLHFLAWKKLFLKERGIKLPESEFKKSIGIMGKITVRRFFKKYKVKGNVDEWRMKKKKIFEEHLKSEIKIYPGIKPLIKKLSKKYKIGIATSSWRSELNIVLKKFELRPYVTKTITKEDIRNHKPHPQIYQKMANKLKVKEQDCVVFEDSVPGVLAAKRAKCRRIAVTNSYPREKLKKADLIVKDIRDKKVIKFIEK